MNDDDERTEIRRDLPPLDERTRAVDRAPELHAPGTAHAPATPGTPVAPRGRATRPAAVRTAAPRPGDRLAHVPGSTAEDASYTVRREPLPTIDRPATSPGASRVRSDARVVREVGVSRRARLTVAVLVVLAFVLLIVGAVAVLAVLVAS
ncbi:hypothetical protein LJR045_001873 [Microbacterium sp. LjRoot45]|uniref:hypothetical protein n=1 Tax=Microbacterium sp. LjRoot45 TaxID=3342329 RepID=UPI003ECDA7D6